MITQHTQSHSNRRAVGGDNAPLVLSSDEEQATSSARRDGSQEPTPPRPSLTSLPTEILERILSFDDELPTNSVAMLLINRPFFAVAYPYWLRSSEVYDSDNGAVLAELVLNRQTASSLRELYLELTPAHPAYQCAIFRHTTNLRHLRIFFEEVAYLPVAHCFFPSLRWLPHLRYLEISHHDREKPVENFSFERDVPSLRHLDIRAKGSLAICAPGLSRLTSLKVHSCSFAASAIPWQSLLHLDMSRDDREERPDNADLQDLLQSLKVVCKDSPIPLQNLTLSFTTRADSGSSGFVELANAMCAPRLTNLTVFDIDSLDTFASWTFDARLPSVKCLTLTGCGSCVSVDELRGLRAILTLCPKLKALRLQGIRFTAITDVQSLEDLPKAKDLILDALDTGSLPFAFPAVSALLFFLQQTSIFELKVDLTHDEGICWRRAAQNEVFEAEGWTTI